MLKIAIPNDSKQGLGGGWTFRNNLIKGLMNQAEVVDIKDADVVLFTSSSMITRETAMVVKELKKPLVLRVDNIPRNSRNRNTGTSRLKAYADMASAIVYQSEWSKSYISPLFKPGIPSEVIYNGIDTDIFNPGTRTPIDKDKSVEDNPIYIYSRFNRDETKSWERAWYQYQIIQRQKPGAKLIIVGNFSQEQIDYNFDFFMGEKFKYLGIVEDPRRMAEIFRTAHFFLATYYNDAYSNTYQEAMACGVRLSNPNMSGGTPELIENGPRGIKEMTRDYLKLFESLK